jgi:hypothetical protein
VCALSGGENGQVKPKTVKQRTNPKNFPRSKRLNPQTRSVSFEAGAIVLVTLKEPREKFWGKLLALDPAGLSLCGIELASFEDATNLFIAGEALSVAVLFFPMHRVERIEIDSPSGTIPSLSQRFVSRTGVQPTAALADREVGRQNG